MKSTRSAVLAAATCLASAAVAVPAATSAVASAPPAPAPTWKVEKGIVVECTGEVHDGTESLAVWTSVYENSRFGNSVQLVLGDPDEGNGKLKEQQGKFLVGGQLEAKISVKGTRVVIAGTAERRGKRTKVDEVIEDAGMQVVSKGFHRRLRTDLTVTVAGVSAPLACAPAFFYHLRVKKTPIT